MSKRCSVCLSDRQAEIDERLIKGESARVLASQYEPSRAAIQRHAKHIPRALTRAAERASELSAEVLFDKVLALQLEVEGILSEARKAKDHNLALSAVKRAQALIETQGKILVAARGTGEPTGDDRIEQALEELRRRREQRRATVLISAPQGT